MLRAARQRGTRLEAGPVPPEPCGARPQAHTPGALRRRVLRSTAQGGLPRPLEKLAPPRWVPAT